MFNWYNAIRDKVRKAILAGVGDALREMDEGTLDTQGSIEYLNGRIEEKPALPAPKPRKETK